MTESEELQTVRSQRPRPHLDDKIIAAWNGLMISAFARAAQILDDASYLQTAEQAAAFVRAQLQLDPDEFILLLSASSRGAHNHVRFLEALQRHRVDVQVVLLCAAVAIRAGAGRDCAGLNGLIASGDRRIAEMEAEQLESLAGDR